MKCLAVLGLVLATAFCIKIGPTPPFLQGESAAKIKEFEDLLHAHHDKVDEDIHTEVWNWARKQTPKIQQKFLDYVKLLEKVHEESEAAHIAAVEDFSPAAKNSIERDLQEADKEIAAIASSKTLTIKQKSEQIDSIVKKLPKHIHEEITAAMRG